jgi:hypothetical protein
VLPVGVGTLRALSSRDAPNRNNAGGADVLDRLDGEGLDLQTYRPSGAPLLW